MVLCTSRWGCEILIVVVLERLVVVVVASFVVLVLRLSTNLVRICFLWERDLLFWFGMPHKVLSMQGGTKRR